MYVVRNCHSTKVYASTVMDYNNITIQVAVLATLALLLAAIGGSDMSLQYIFVIIYVGMHQSEVYELWIVRVVEAGSNIVYICGDDPLAIMQPSSHAAVYMLLHDFTFTLLSTTMPSFQPLVE